MSRCRKKNANNEPVTDENGAYVYDENIFEALGTVTATDSMKKWTANAQE